MGVCASQGITWVFENALRMINPATAAHYW